MSLPERIEALLAAEDPAWVLQGVELMFTLSRSVWLPIVSRLEEITVLAYRLELVRGLAGLTRWDVAAYMSTDIQQVVRWECGEPVSLQTAGDLACATGRKVLPGFFLQPATSRPTMITLDSQPWDEVALKCDVPGCSTSTKFREYDFAGAKRKARRRGWRLDPDHWCYCPAHRHHPPVGGPALAALRPRQVALFGGAR